MNAIELYRNLLRGAHDFLERTVGDVTREQLNWDPPGNAFSIGANYVHVVASEDMGIQRLLRGKEPLATTTWAGKLGAPEPPPMGPGVDLKGWSRRVKLDAGALRRYAEAVYAATDDHLASLTPEALTRPLDLSQFGFGQQSVLFILSALLANASLHTGEISCLKGIQGMKGYPM